MEEDNDRKTVPSSPSMSVEGEGDQTDTERRGSTPGQSAPTPTARAATYATASNSGSGSASGSRAQSQSKTTPASVSSGAAGAPGDSRNLSKRKRGLGVVTPNACTACRKKRAKCDGQQPCGRCQGQSGVECVYEVPVRQSKEHLRSELENLRQKQRNSDQVIAALVRPELCNEVLTRLRGGQKVENISEWLDSPDFSGPDQLPPFMPQGGNHGVDAGQGTVLPPLASTMSNISFGPGSPTTSARPGSNAPHLPSGLHNELHAGTPPPPPLQWSSFPAQSQGASSRSNSHPDNMSWTTDLRGPPQSRVGSWAESIHPSDQMSDVMPRFWGLEQVLSPLNEPEMRSPSGTWTNVTGNINLAQHLLALYFCWEYPTFASLSKEHFLRDFQDGRERYCSSMLVNAMLSLGCRFSTQPMTRANPNDPFTSGDHFFKESLQLYHQETDHHNLTTIQALGIMSIREASCGRDSESWYYAGQSVRLAIEMGLHRLHDHGDEDELAVQAATFWGAFALDHAWSLATGSLPQCTLFPHLPPKPAIIDDIEASLWVPYTDDGAPLQRSCEQPSNVRSVYKCFCELSELVHESLYILHSPGRPLTARDLLNMYTKYLNWYGRIPEVLRLGHNFTPAVLFAHMYYHFAILLLFRPLIKLRIVGSKITPRDVCAQAADAIQSLLKSYSQLYTLRRTPSFVPYFVLTSSIMHLAIGAASISSTAESTEEEMKKAAKLDPRISEAVNQGIADLAEMAPCHHFAAQALNILRYLARKWNVNTDIDKKHSAPEGFEQIVRPRTDSLNFLVPDVQEGDFLCTWGNQTQKSTTTGSQPEQSTTKTDYLENHLFWPFPMQGRPMLPQGKELEAAGFALV